VWETVRGKKTKDRVSALKEPSFDKSTSASSLSSGGNSVANGGAGKFVKEDATVSGGSNIKPVSDSKFQNAELNENYVPRAVRNDLDEILYSSDSTFEKIRNLNKKVNGFVNYKKSKDIDWRKRINIYIIHKSCKQNKQEIIASIIDHSKDPNMYVNAISSTMSGNTCLFDAAYFGSDQCMNFLINRGADINHKNKLGETIFDIIENGKKDSMKKYQNATLIIEERYNECVRLVKMAQENKASGGAGDSSVNEDHVEAKPEFKTEYDFDSLKEDVIEFIENPDKFRKFVAHIKEHKLTDLLVDVLDDEDVMDVLVDNPYAAKLV
jgi:hypothetical protein